MDITRVSHGHEQVPHGYADKRNNEVCNTRGGENKIKLCNPFNLLTSTENHNKMGTIN